MQRYVVRSGLVGVALLMLAAPPASGGVQGRWSKPFTVTACCHCTSAPLIASSARHGSTVAWFQHTPNREVPDVWARRIRRDGSLAPKRKLGNGAEYSSNGWIAAGRSGAIVLAWQSQDGIHARRISPRGKIGRLHRIASGGIDLEIRVAVDARGNATIAWGGTWSISSQGSSPPDPPNVHVRRLSAKGNLGRTIELPQEAATYHEWPRVAVAPSGRATVVWTAGGIRAATIDENGAVGPALPVSQQPTRSAAELAIDAHGNATVVWQSAFPMESTTVRRITAAGKLGPEYVPAPAHRNGGAQIGLDRKGNARLTWSSEPRDFSHRLPSVVESWRLGANDTVSGVTTLSPPGLAPPDSGDGLPGLVVDSAGDAMVAWLRGTGTGDNHEVATLTRRVASDGTLGPPHILAKPGQLAEFALAVDARGIVTAVWSREAPDRAVITAARFTPRR